MSGVERLRRREQTKESGSRRRKG